MSLTPKLVLGLWNAWLLLLPMLIAGGLITARRKDVATRLSDMTGYSRGERLVTVLASLLPYPFVAVALFTPLLSVRAALIVGALLSVLGSAGFFSTLVVFARTPADRAMQSGPYRLSRNPLYVSAALIFLGVCVATGSLLLAGILALMLAFQHFMILAEERSCRRRYGAAYLTYAQRTPRYLGLGRG